MAGAGPERQPDREPQGRGAAAREAGPGGPLAGAAWRTFPATVLGLQRACGNAAVGRLLGGGRALARTPVGSLGEADAATPLTGPVHLEHDDVIISDVTGPRLTSSGGYDWGVAYSLPFPADFEGWMIQELWMEASGAAPGTHFWECWRVRGGSRIPADRGTEGWDDHYVFGNVPGAPQPASGWKRHTGIIHFYPGALPPEFGPENAGQHFYSAHTRPAGWTGRGTRHDAYSEWAPGRNGFVGYAGTAEIRAGDRVTFRPR